jgi:hypothetical protein
MPQAGLSALRIQRLAAHSGMAARYSAPDGLEVIASGAKRWPVYIFIGEHRGNTNTEARLHTGYDTHLVGAGNAKLNPADEDIPEIGVRRHPIASAWSAQIWSDVVVCYRAAPRRKPIHSAAESGSARSCHSIVSVAVLSHWHGHDRHAELQCVRYARHAAGPVSN